MQKDVLFLIDNVFRFVQAGRSFRAPRAPALAGGLSADTRDRNRRTRGAHCFRGRRGSTSIQAVYVPADDFTDPAVANVFTHLDASIVLSRDMASQGLYPAIDPLDSTSVMLDARVVGERITVSPKSAAA